ncbi:family transcriptional regulator : MerR family transcriptional regulator OS=Candidatus Entotheonella sp. TSY2 GN=ETSY2_48225 PE=4 SV=1: MerR: MerR-DNA-bind [Gemmataceae bacterium]|nr:family transcriptional regulator : MerR family transcriptional regulator OS=Candidatus Entotheonella sp. TSY2 GN=ETSY2_48225 PE=4 SV=1: MerR: MerR-DNA-bind [Gemmataceae bacterium]VTU01458.1 family transcriptional regulator : MerR family transcriptional regulator OS=Candidatus Entotheonella sp. TSY2 GN=ETSY2_48225 PE=4 SV=1: MerR: MerR-DNA-bind [Gemmataceae bacterium]
MGHLKIGQLGTRSGVGVETLRFYEREGLLPEPERLPSGYRQYEAEAVERVQFIRVAQFLGFQLKDVKELLALRDNPDATRAEVRERAVSKVVEIDTRLRGLEAIRADLVRLVTACDGGCRRVSQPCTTGGG